jgi:carbamoyltransferase
MSVVLGVSALYHDAAVALVVDGHLRGALQQERMSRLKGDPRLPIAAANAVLADANMTAADVDAVVFYENPFARLEHVLVSTLRGFPRTLRQFPRAMAAQLSHKLWVKDDLASALGIDRKRVHHDEHHRSHAASSYFASGAASAAVLCIDGVGEDTCTSIWRGEGRTLRLVSRQLFPHSIGLFYAAITAWLGFRVLEGEQQVMGLAALGSPTQLDVMERLARIQSDGSIELDLSCFAHHTDDTLGFSNGLVRLLGPPRVPGTPWQLDDNGVPIDAADRHYADVAASAQAHTEALLLALARQARAVCPDVDTLCLAGGVALNACANGALAQHAGFARIFVQPAAGDAGGALGAAWNFANDHGDVPRPLAHAAWGPTLTTGAVVPLARASGLVAQPVTPAEAVARLWSGHVLALVDGRSEWGPRALGHRSLLAAPGPREVQHRINTAIKRREPFRPFAPAVLDDDAGVYFDHVAPDLGRFMTGVSTTKPAFRDALGAVTHHDGTARVQSVDEHAPALRALLLAAKAAGHPPVLLNTSLNGRREPICQGAVDVVRFLLAHPDVNGAIVDDVLITRP